MTPWEQSAAVPAGQRQDACQAVPSIPCDRTNER
ncbi:MAG: hypothetical protein QOI79_1100 [Mycobacterium sp.]|jgi:hypothetical protein|nr:hypothetical protein [Mycobacterium sp.]MDT5056042.1 hypothetical protein [Mycobacterium sp.]MDT5141763.1 hypothetical protein [Mycobacterium sp.]